MANPDILIPFILSWEGGFVNHPKDPGGPTNRGVTISTFRSVFGALSSVDQLRAMSDAQWRQIFLTKFWDKYSASQIQSQSVANLLVDWLWASGPGYAVKIPQQMLGVKPDGIVGPFTIAAINDRIRAYGARDTFLWLFDRRERFIRLCRNFDTFGTGWLNRLKSIGFESLTLNKFTTQGGRRIPVTQTFPDNA